MASGRMGWVVQVFGICLWVFAAPIFESRNT